MRHVIARWESQRGKDWVEVYEESRGSGELIGCGYHSRNGCGWMGNIPRDVALLRIQERLSRGAFCSQKSPMRKVV